MDIRLEHRAGAQEEEKESTLHGEVPSRVGEARGRTEAQSAEKGRVRRIPKELLSNTGYRRQDEHLDESATTAPTVAEQQADGTRRVHAESQAQGFATGQDHIGPLRRRMGSRCGQQRRYHPAALATGSNHTPPVAKTGCTKSSLQACRTRCG